MKYMLLIYGNEAAGAQASEADLHAEGAAYEKFTKSIVDSGNFLDGDPFLPTSVAKTVRVRGGQTETVEGPAVATSPEQLIAYYKVEADGPETALGFAAQIPGARHGSIEVRPVMAFD